MLNVRESCVVVWAIVCAISIPSSAWADDGQCPDPEVRAGVGGRVRGGAHATGGLVGNVGGGAVDATGDVAGGTVDATVGVAGTVAGSLPAPGSPDVGRLGEIGLGFETEGRLDEAWLALHRYKLEAQAQYEADRARIDAAI